MDYYLSIKLHPDPELPETVLMNSVFAKLHRLLVNQPDWDVGISFPSLAEAATGLGQQLRLHGDKGTLEELATAQWLGGLAGYLTLTKVLAAPSDCLHVNVKRVQSKSSPARLASRYQRRHNETEEEALKRYQGMKPKKLSLPYVTLNSSSTGQQFKLFIQQSEPLAEAAKGPFTRYGLSQTGTVPWF